MHLFFAGLARNCEGEVVSNIHALVRLASLVHPDSFTIYVCENDSVDQTRSLILNAATMHFQVKPVFLDGLTSDIPDLVPRISYCRNLLLDKIKSASQGLSNALYIPVDLDSSIASSIDCLQFEKAIAFILGSQWNAVFPFSSPYYYDIYALRAKSWCSYDCAQKMRHLKARGESTSLLSFLWYVSRHQRHCCPSQADPIPVDSAFGGMGIYRLDAIRDSRYSTTLDDALAIRCEHVNFNMSIANKCILPWLLVHAPKEHIRLKIISRNALFARLAKAFFSDVDKLVTRLLRKPRSQTIA